MTNSMWKGKQILLIGAGSMAEAMIRGLTDGGAVQPPQIVVTNRCDRDRLEELQSRYGVRAVTDPQELADVMHASDLVVLAVKPHDSLGVLESHRRQLAGKVLLSVAAGISTALMEEVVGPQVQVVRAMPNTACAVLQSATAVCYGTACTVEGRALAEAVMSCLGTVCVVTEEQMDLVTGVSGSGPAYFYYMVECMQQAAERLGLPAEIARGLVLQTLFGAGKMLQESGREAAELRRQVTSPNGTTMAGLQVFEQADFHHLIHEVITSATVRSAEMGEQQKANRRTASA